MRTQGPKGATRDRGRIGPQVSPWGQRWEVLSPHGPPQVSAPQTPKWTPKALRPHTQGPWGPWALGPTGGPAVEPPPVGGGAGGRSHPWDSRMVVVIEVAPSTFVTGAL